MLRDTPDEALYVCKDISSLLDGIDEAKLRSVIDYNARAEAHFYKVENVGRISLASAIIEDFQTIRAFYAGTVRIGLAAMVYKE